MKVGVIGTGYVGLITGVGLATKGHNVTCFDKQPEIIKGLNAGSPHIYEKGLMELLDAAIMNGRFKAQLISESHLVGCEVIIIAVGTPSVNGKIDLGYIKSAAKTVGMALRSTSDFTSIIIKSTVVPGTTDTVVRRIVEESSGKKLGQFGMGMNPEFLREGNAIEDFMNPDRIVLGYDDSETLKLLQELYSPWDCSKIEVNTRTAEMIKYANNFLLATQISAVNELANIAAATSEIDILDVMCGVHSDKRWNPILPDGKRINPDILSYLVPGCGFGGSCFPKDLQALRTYAVEAGIDPHVLNAVIRTNDDQPYEVIKLLEKSLGSLEHKKILILGLTFKPDTDDVRESISLKIINYLSQAMAQVFVHDPVGIDNAKKQLDNISNISYVNQWKALLKEVDAIVIATKWSEYKELSDNENLMILKGKIVLDARRLFNPWDFPDSIYLTIGRNRRKEQR